MWPVSSQVSRDARERERDQERELVRLERERKKEQKLERKKEQKEQDQEQKQAPFLETWIKQKDSPLFSPLPCTNIYAEYGTPNQLLINILGNVLNKFSLDLVGIVEQYSRELRHSKILHAHIPFDSIDLLFMNQDANDIFVLSRFDKHIHKYSEIKDEFNAFHKPGHFATMGPTIIGAIDGYLLYRTERTASHRNDFCILNLATMTETEIELRIDLQHLYLAENRGQDGFLLFGSSTRHNFVTSYEPYRRGSKHYTATKTRRFNYEETKHAAIINMMAHADQVFINYTHHILITNYNLESLRIITNTADEPGRFNFNYLYCMQFDPIDKILFAVDHKLHRVIAMNIENKGYIVQTWDLPIQRVNQTKLPLIWWNSKTRQLLFYENTKHDYDRIHIYQ